jgi:hypothetical protein
MVPLTPSSRRILLSVIPVEQKALKIKHEAKQNLKITLYALDNLDEMFQSAFDLVESWQAAKFYDFPGGPEDPDCLAHETLDTNVATFCPGHP